MVCIMHVVKLHVVKLTDKNQQVVSSMELFFSQKPDSDFSTADWYDVNISLSPKIYELKTQKQWQETEIDPRICKISKKNF